jgi:hypothetical protein
MDELDVSDNPNLKVVRANYSKLESVDVSGCENLLEFDSVKIFSASTF